jgi:hypothetical protein
LVRNPFALALGVSHLGVISTDKTRVLSVLTKI